MLEKLIGNDPVKTILRRFLRETRVPNALLFAGPEGVGKKHFAFELAKAVVCRDPRDHEACGECASCRRIDVIEFPKSDERDDHKAVIFTEHPDVGMVIPYNRNILVDAVRNLETEANFRPFEAVSRIFIVDDADKMNESASNALLKTLEEPPVTSHLILITSKPDALLPTIRSRCQMMRFAPVRKDEIEKLLLPTHQYSQSEAQLVAAYSRGSVAAAVSIDVDEFRLKRESAMNVLRSAVLTKDRVLLLKTAEEVSDAKNKGGYEKFLDVLQSVIHDAWSIKAGGDELVNTDLVEELYEIAQAADARRLAEWLNEIEELRENLAVNINKRIATDALFVRMAGV